MDLSQHVPVLFDEVLAALDPQPGQTIVDGTLGGGSHTRALAERVGDGGQVIAFDRDPHALARAEQQLRGLPIKLAHADYRELPDILRQLKIDRVDGALLDLGLSSDQLADGERGFSFTADGTLDLRFDPETGEPAWRLLQRLEEKQIADLIFQYGEERFSRRIARNIVARRRETPLRTAADLVSIVAASVPRSAQDQRIHPATRTFQALRIAVNDELGALETALKVYPDWLASGGRIAIISFHSLEDRLVKQAFRDDDRLQVVTRKPIIASDAETARNARSRSAKLRVAQRV